MDGTESSELAELALSEVTLGRVIGEGGFCTVSPVLSVDLQEVYDTGDAAARFRRAFATAANQGGRSEGGCYVVKRLRTDLAPEEHEKAVLDLAIEAEFLRVLRHKNVIGMRAVGNCDPHEARFFVMLDRLAMMLEKKFNLWRKVVEENTGFWFPLAGYCCAKTQILHQTWKERIGAAYEIAQAIQYLHHLGIVYRDLKPDNIGFDRTGELKLFDFGLAKRLGDVEKLSDDVYRLTGNTGSLRYMAPECRLDKPYGLSVDSYSFGIIFWQICSLTTPFAKMGEQAHLDSVVRGNVRPTPDATWPLSWVELMTACWDENPTKRPVFDEIVYSLGDRVEELEEDDGVIPTRAHEIRAKKNKKSVSPGNRAMDEDTRKHTDYGAKRIDTEVV